MLCIQVHSYVFAIAIIWSEMWDQLTKINANLRHMLVLLPFHCSLSITVVSLSRTFIVIIVVQRVQQMIVIGV